MTALCGWGGSRCTVQLPKRGLCDEHRAAIRATEAAGPTRDQTEADAKAVALEVLRTGAVARSAAAETLGYNAGRMRAAVDAAVRLDWVAVEPRDALVPGTVIPPGRIKREIRAAMLARYVKTAAPRVVPLAEAAEAVGVGKAGVPRIVAWAREQAWVTVVRGPNGGVAAT